jgi:hypothetical protein
MERYSQIAFRGGLEGLPPNSLIGLTHHLTNFLNQIYEKIKAEILAAIVLQADETTQLNLPPVSGKLTIG